MTTERVLNGRYEVGELIGRGGMADVHLGRDVRLGRSVAIKLLRRDLARDPLFQSRFRREAQAVAALNHSTIVSVYDTGEEEIEGQSDHDVRVPFIVMEFVAGRTLRDLIKQGNLTLDRSTEHMIGVLSALEYSHKAGIVHRDIKPANVMITPEGNVKVMDFGIARAIADSAATMTQTQAVIGTAQYLSPEQARGETVDARSDLYSAGCLLYELLTGRPPFVGDSPVSVAYQHVREAPKPASTYNPDVSPAFDSVLKKALEKDRENRFQNAASFRAALEDAGKGVLASTPAGSDPTEAFGTLPAAPLAVPADEEPRTRAMAKVLAGGTMASSPLLPDEDTGALPTALAVGNKDDVDERQRSRRRAWMTTFFFAVALVIAAGVFLVYKLANVQPEVAPTVAVPAVQNMTEIEAENALRAAGLRAQIDPVFHETVEEGLVIGSDPASGAEVEPDSIVTLDISKGPSTAVIPASIAGMTEASAREELLSAGLRGGTVTEGNSATVPVGRVISADPAIGQTVGIDSEVNLVLSNGKVVVPRLIELPRAEAEAILTDPERQLGVNVEEVENAVVKPGTVTAQSIPPNGEVDQGAVVTITVAKEPAPEPAPSKTASPSPTPAPSPTGGQPEGRGILDLLPGG